MDLYNYKILLIHSGGLSQRMPNASVLGKIFSPLPKGNPIYQILDIKLAMFYPLIPKMPCGVFVTCADDLIVYNLGNDHEDVTFAKTGFTALAHPSTLAVGAVHGVYVIKDIDQVDPRIPLQSCECLEVLQKPSEVVMHKKGAVLKATDRDFADGVQVKGKAAYTDSSFFFAHDITKKLLAFIEDIGGLNCEIDAYGDFLQALGSRATSDYTNNASNVSMVTPGLYQTRKTLFNALCGSTIRLLVMNSSKFIHIGTTKEYIEYFCCDDIFQAEVGLAKDVFNLWTKEPSMTTTRPGSEDSQDQPTPVKVLRLSDTALGCVMHSCLPTESYISSTAIVEFCKFDIPVKVGQNCILSSCEFESKVRVKDAETGMSILVEYMNHLETLDFPNDLFIHTIPINENSRTKFVTVFFDIKDDLKKEAPRVDIKRLPFLGKFVEDYTAMLSIDIVSVRPICTNSKINLWYSNLFPVAGDSSESLALALQCLHAVKTDNPRVTSLASFQLVSMATLLKQKDVEAMLEKRNVLYNAIKFGDNTCTF